MPGGAGQGTVGKRNGGEPLSDAPLQRLGEKSITRSPFVWGGGNAKDKESRGTVARLGHSGLAVAARRRSG